ncbi:MAG: hypothetical protein SGARI_000962 [Bacillariaceae sp.]
MKAILNQNKPGSLPYMVDHDGFAKRIRVRTMFSMNIFSLTPFTFKKGKKAAAICPHCMGLCNGNEYCLACDRSETVATVHISRFPAVNTVSGVKVYINPAWIVALFSRSPHSVSTRGRNKDKELMDSYTVPPNQVCKSGDLRDRIGDKVKRRNDDTMNMTFIKDRVRNFLKYWKYLEVIPDGMNEDLGMDADDSVFLIGTRIWRAFYLHEPVNRIMSTINGFDVDTPEAAKKPARNLRPMDRKRKASSL